jgi:hypothetical protein
MTGAEVRALSRPAVRELYDTLKADRLPVGTFDGRTWPVPVWPLWRGKAFTACLCGCDCCGTVRNRIGPFLFMKGEAEISWDIDVDELVIRYPLGLTDYLKPVSDTLWLGYLKLGPWRLWFTLEAVP